MMSPHTLTASLLVSEMGNERPKVFYGWWVALTAALGLFLNTATVVVFSFGFFAKAIGQEFHGGRAKISLAFTIHNLTAARLSRWLGGWSTATAREECCFHSQPCSV
jgi:hypothetical protein